MRVLKIVDMIHPSIKKSLGFESSEEDLEFLEKWKELTSNKRKPCWVLKYCPYGELVEQFPLLPPLRAWAIQHDEYVKACLEKGVSGVEPDVKPMNEKMRELFEKEVSEFNPDNYPEEIPLEIVEWSCQIFGHICPVVFSAENVTEEEDQKWKRKLFQQEKEKWKHFP